MSNGYSNLKRGEICMVCNKKFLYRDAMYELMRKLKIRELQKQQKEMDLAIDEKSFE